MNLMAEHNERTYVNLTESRHSFSISNKIGRVLWNIISFFLYKPFSPRFFRKWRVFVLRCFGAKVSYKATIHASVVIWAPWNLEAGDFTCIGPKADCYNQGKITLGKNVTISQKAYLCASTHDYLKSGHPLILKPIEIEDRAWVAAEAFIGPGVKIKEGAVVGARSAVFKNVDSWTVVGGNPAKFVKMREIEDA